MRRAIADFVARSAAAVVGRLDRPPQNPLATLAFRVAGGVIRLLGGHLESRIMSFVVPAGSPDVPVVARTLETLQAALGAEGMSLRISETQLSREAALESDDVRPLVPDGAVAMTFYELCVPTHTYWKASHVTERVLARLNAAELSNLEHR